MIGVGLQLWEEVRCAKENFIALVANEKLADVVEVEARPAEERSWTRVFSTSGVWWFAPRPRQVPRARVAIMPPARLVLGLCVAPGRKLGPFALPHVLDGCAPSPFCALRREIAADVDSGAHPMPLDNAKQT